MKRHQKVLLFSLLLLSAGIMVKMYNHSEYTSKKVSIKEEVKKESIKIDKNIEQVKDNHVHHSHEHSHKHEQKIIRKPAAVKKITYTKLEKSLVSKLKANNFNLRKSQIEFTKKPIKGHDFFVLVQSKVNGRQYSFNAQVNHKTGRLLRTWGRTHYEDFHGTPKELVLRMPKTQ